MRNIILSLTMLVGISMAMPAWAGFFSSGCEGGNDEAEPEWVSRPDYSLPNYYVGVGASDKADKVERLKESEMLAKKELVEHIEVTIKAENRQAISVNNLQVQKDAHSNVTVSAAEVLRGLDIKSRWLDKDSCMQYTLVIISKKAVEQAKLEKSMKNKLGKFNELLEDGRNHEKIPDIKERRKKLDSAQELLQEIDFKLLTELADVNKREFYERQLKGEFDLINKETWLTKDRMALFVLNKDHNLSDEVIGKMLDHLRTTDQLTDRLMDGCKEEQDCIKAAQNRGFTKLTMLLSNCQIAVSQMGSLKGTLKVTKKIYDLESRKVMGEPRTTSAEVIGWSNEELDWGSAAEKVMREMK